MAYETIATGLAVPWGIAFAPDGRVFVTERPGRIRTIVNGQLQQEPWATVDVIAAGESGLMGIALSPDFERDRHVYVVATYLEKSTLFNHVLRFKDVNGRASALQVLIDSIPAAEFHAGDAIAFGPDGMLYIATGDAGKPGDAADLKSLAGKILRYTPEGGIPADNPYPGSPLYALGIRNSQGLAWHPETKDLLAIDHGPSGFPNERFRRNNDELNVIIRGGNYGWPEEAGMSDDPDLIAPISVWNPGIAPGGLAIWQGSAFVGGLRGQQLRQLTLARSGNGYRVTEERALFKEELGRIRAVVAGPDGHLYFATSNWDGRGDPREGDDRILRLRAKTQ